MKEKAKEIKQGLEGKSPEEKERVGKFQKFVESRGWDHEKVAELIDHIMKADVAHPELKDIEKMSSEDFAKFYKRMVEELKVSPEKYEEHIKASGMNADDLTILFSELEGAVIRYPEVWESRDAASLLGPKNLHILLDVFKKDAE